MKTLKLMLAAAMVLIPVSANAQDVLSADVLKANQASYVDLGSKKALGYYGKRNGKCDLTVMVIEDAPGFKPVSGRSDASAARLRVAINPGNTARIESDNGRSVAFFCNSGARRLTVMTLGDKTDDPTT